VLACGIIRGSFLFAEWNRMEGAGAFLIVRREGAEVRRGSGGVVGGARG
jgi:hypothetical protein